MKKIIDKRRGALSLCFALILCALFLGGCFGRPEQKNYYNTYNYGDDRYMVELCKDAVKKAVVIKAGDSWGSGCIVAVNGSNVYIVTNNHVIDSSPASIVVWFHDDTVFSSLGAVVPTLYTVTSLARSGSMTTEKTKYDFAVLKVQTSNASSYQPFTLKNDIDFGQRVIAVGNGMAYGISVCEGLISNPETKSVTADDYQGPAIQITCPINSGNSGGALVDMECNLVGITTFKAVMPADIKAGIPKTYADNISFALSIDLLKGFLNAAANGTGFSPAISPANKTELTNLNTLWINYWTPEEE